MHSIRLKGDIENKTPKYTSKKIKVKKVKLILVLMSEILTLWTPTNIRRLPTIFSNTL